MTDYPLTPYVVQIAVASNGNPQVIVRERNNSALHPDFPPIALPGHTYPTALAAEEYATALVRVAGLLAADRPLVFISSGYTMVKGQRMAARSAPLPV